MTDTLNYQGHVYVDAGEAECPIVGDEDGMVATQTEEGVPAWWGDGHLFVLDQEQSENIPILNAWANK